MPIASAIFSIAYCVACESKWSPRSSTKTDIDAYIAPSKKGGILKPQEAGKC